MAAPVAVTHAITLLELGGAQQNTLHTVAQLDRSRFAPSLVAGAGGLLDADAARLADVRFVTCPALVRPIAPHLDLAATAWLTRWFRRTRPAIVHTHSSKAGVVGRLAAALAGVPVIVHSVHGWGFHPHQGRPRRAVFVGLERLVAPMTTHFIAVSDANRRVGLDLGLAPAGRWTVIHSGVELARFRAAAGDTALRRELGLADDTPLAGMVACLKPQKAPEDFVAVAARVLREVPRAHFVLAGDGELRGAVEDAVAAQGIGDRFHVLGWRRDPERVVGALDVLVLTSLHEGLPRVAPEAMAAGKPVVATAVDGTPEAVRDGRTGFLHRVHDVEGLASSIARLLNDRALARAFGEHGARASRAWDIDEMVREQERLYARLLAEAGIVLRS